MRRISKGGASMSTAGEIESKLLDMLSSGCDSRIVLDPVTGLNRYHLNPIDYDGLLNRGSCTANTLNPHSHALAEQIVKAESTGREDLPDEQRQRLRSLVGAAEVEFDVFFAPSGTDLAYLPTILQTLLTGNRPIRHIVSCPEELGSGSVWAAAARFHSKTNQFGDEVPAHELVDPDVDPEVVELPARSASGRILDRTEEIRYLLRSRPEADVIVSLVYGSKSGIGDDLELIEEYAADAVWVVDLCQLRVDGGLISRLLRGGAMVMLTGSKFFEAPPYCGALLVPRVWTDRLADIDPDRVKYWASLFDACDFPKSLTWRDRLEYRHNVGLRLRWEIALDEMERYARIAEPLSSSLISDWNEIVSGEIEASPVLSLMPDSSKTNPSIISFDVQSGQRSLTYNELRQLHETVVTSTDLALPSGRHRAFFGQPVKYPHRSFLRLAIGSVDVRAAVGSGAPPRFEDDLYLVELIQRTSRRLFG